MATRELKIGRNTIFIIPFDVSGVFAIIPRPRGGEWLGDDLATLAQGGIEVVISLLETHEAEELGLAAEASSCRANGLQFFNIPVPDLGVPTDLELFLRVVLQALLELRAGRHVAVHCRQSVGRSGLFAVAIGVATGMPLHAAIATVSTGRRVNVPETAAQVAWLHNHLTELAGLAN